MPERKQDLRMPTIIVETVDPEQVILFGSRARGDAEADSDVDLVVVEANRWRGSLNHVLGRALREGRVLYERP